MNTTGLEKNHVWNHVHEVGSTRWHLLVVKHANRSHVHCETQQLSLQISSWTESKNKEQMRNCVWNWANLPHDSASLRRWHFERHVHFKSRRTWLVAKPLKMSKPFGRLRCGVPSAPGSAACGWTWRFSADRDAQVVEWFWHFWRLSSFKVYLRPCRFPVMLFCSWCVRNTHCAIAVNLNHVKRLCGRFAHFQTEFHICFLF